MKRLALTFDDGPNPYYTPKVLDLLKDTDTKATFFVVAKNAAEQPKLIERMKKEGHGIALHSLEHRHAFLCSYRYMEKDFKKSMELLKDLQCDIRYYRPPWGVRNLFTGKFVKKYMLHMVLWDVMAGDWKAGNTPDRIARELLDKVFDGAVICLHDGGENYGGAKGAPFHTIAALKKVIPELKKAGYEFVTVEEYYENE
jgi:peptidoglycan/xylan/chitin deacetylase (PgdA/CDA1 family)